jgi:hypothetical protein
VSSLPPYALSVAELPDHLLPGPARRRLVIDLDAVPERSSRLHLEGAAGPPPGVYVPPAVHHDPWTGWVRDVRHAAWWPYLLDQDDVRALEEVGGGEQLRRPPDPLRRWQLAAAGALTSGDDARTTDDWCATVEQARAQLTDGWAVVPDLLEPNHLARLRRHYRTLRRQGAAGSGCFTLGDANSPDRYSAHNEPVATYVHYQLADAVGQLVGRPVRPSFCFSVTYDDGATLGFHDDRWECQYTLSILLDAWPEPTGRSRWPLVLNLPGGRRAAYQYLGDALLFTGRTVVHGRPPQPAGHLSTSLLFHYVDGDFIGPLR